MGGDDNEQVETQGKRKRIPRITTLWKPVVPDVKRVLDESHDVGSFILGQYDHVTSDLLPDEVEIEAIWEALAKRREVMARDLLNSIEGLKASFTRRGLAYCHGIVRAGILVRVSGSYVPFAGVD
jgi:hypothetical protein